MNIDKSLFDKLQIFGQMHSGFSELKAETKEGEFAEFIISLPI